MPLQSSTNKNNWLWVCIMLRNVVRPFCFVVRTWASEIGLMKRLLSHLWLPLLLLLQHRHLWFLLHLLWMLVLLLNKMLLLC
jgi:hypothetical protein